jgi:hypothetical protein
VRLQPSAVDIDQRIAALQRLGALAQSEDLSRYIL